jgi:hypothetical protein
MVAKVPHETPPTLVARLVLTRRPMKPQLTIRDIFCYVTCALWLASLLGCEASAKSAKWPKNDKGVIVIKVVTFNDGRVEVNGAKIESPSKLEPELDKLGDAKMEIQLYRQRDEKQRIHPHWRIIVGLAKEREIPLLMATKPDFSDAQPSTDSP